MPRETSLMPLGRLVLAVLDSLVEPHFSAGTAVKRRSANLVARLHSGRADSNPHRQTPNTFSRLDWRQIGILAALLISFVASSKLARWQIQGAKGNACIGCT